MKHGKYKYKSVRKVWSFCFELGDSLTTAVLEHFLLAIEFFDTYFCEIK